MLDWDDLRHVLAVHREGSLTQAASSLGVTRTTVGRRLRSAEAELGVRLFDRTPEGLVATIAGHDLARTAAKVEEEILASEGRVLGRDAALRGPLRVSTVDFVYECYADVFAAFVARYPGIALTVNATEDNVSLLRREADVALRIGNAPAEHLVGRKVAHLVFEVYAARSLCERVGPERSWRDMPWLHQDERSDTRWLDGWLAEHAPDAPIAMRCGSFEVIRRSLRAGIGVFFLPPAIGDADPDLVRLGRTLAEQTRDLWALTLPDLRHNRRVRAFMDHVYEAFASDDQGSKR